MAVAAVVVDAAGRCAQPARLAPPAPQEESPARRVRLAPQVPQVQPAQLGLMERGGRLVPLAQPALTVRGGRLVPLVLTERAVRLARLAQLALMVHGVLMV